MIRFCVEADLYQIWTVINDGAEAYRGVIPQDCWHEPYMTQGGLLEELASGVNFWCYEQDGTLQAVMGMQHVQDVTLLRHAYVRTSMRRRGFGSFLLEHIKASAERPLLIGTWADASWAISFYEKHGFHVVAPERENRLLRTYWDIPERQIGTSVVLSQNSYSEMPRTPFTEAMSETQEDSMRIILLSSHRNLPSRNNAHSKHVVDSNGSCDVEVRT